MKLGDTGREIFISAILPQSLTAFLLHLEVGDFQVELYSIKEALDESEKWRKTDFEEKLYNVAMETLSWLSRCEGQRL